MVTEYKCVDIAFIDPKMRADAVKKGYFGVCEYCTHFVPDNDDEPAIVGTAGSATKPEQGNAYTQTNPMMKMKMKMKKDISSTVLQPDEEEDDEFIELP